MPDIIIYSTATCSYCTQAKQLFDRKKVSYTEIRIDLEPEQRDIMIARTGRKTVPQIFIDDRHIGGFDDLYALDRAGELDPLL